MARIGVEMLIHGAPRVEGNRLELEAEAFIFDASFPNAAYWKKLMRVGSPVGRLFYAAVLQSVASGSVWIAVQVFYQYLTPVQATVLGLLLTPALIKGWLGLPPLGIQSAAYAGLVSYAAALGFLVWRLNRRQHVLAFDAELLGALRLDRVILGKVMRIGLPTGLQMVVISMSELVILSLVNGHGSQATAAYGAVTQIVNYVQFPALSIAITASILAAQSIGAGKVERLSPILRTGLWLNLVLTGSLVLLGYALSHHLLGLFLTDPGVRLQAEQLLHIMLWSLLLFSFQAVVGGIMRASGVVLMPMAISIFCIICVQLPVAYLLDLRLGLPGVWLITGVSHRGTMMAPTPLSSR